MPCSDAGDTTDTYLFRQGINPRGPPGRLGTLGPVSDPPIDDPRTGPGAGLLRTVELCAPLGFAPLPEVVDDAAGWRPMSELDLDAGSGDAFSVAAAAAAELTDCPAGPHAVHALRSLVREVLWSQSATVLLTGVGLAVTAEGWLLSGVGDGPGSIRHGVPRRAVGPVPAQEAAHTVVAVVTPLVEAIRAHTQVGRRTLWSYVLDTSTMAMLVLARQLGRDRRADWETAEAWQELLVAAGVPSLSSPRLAAYGPHDHDLWGVRGACCLDFKDPHHGYCLTCPILDHDTRAARWTDSPLATPPGQ